MIHCVCTFGISQLLWVPQLIRHYRKIGVETFWLTPQVDAALTPEAIEAEWARACSVLAEVTVFPLLPLVGRFDAELLRRHHDSIQARCIDPDDWIVWADADEFHVFPSALPPLLSDLERDGINAVSGEMLDRISRAGTFQPFDPALPIWSQYPIACDITSSICGGFTHKVVAARASVRVTPGNHEVSRKGAAPVWASEVAAIHHFKWDYTVLERMRPRLADDWKARFPYWVETQRLFDHVSQYSRINLQNLAVYDFGDGHHQLEDPAAWAFVAALRGRNQRWRSHRGSR
jgi:hypothetical protein